MTDTKTNEPRQAKRPRERAREYRMARERLQAAQEKLAASGSVLVFDGRRIPIAEVDDELLGKCLGAGHTGHCSETPAADADHLDHYEKTHYDESCGATNGDCHVPRASATTNHT